MEASTQLQGDVVVPASTCHALLLATAKVNKGEDWQLARARLHLQAQASRTCSRQRDASICTQPCHV